MNKPKLVYINENKKFISMFFRNGNSKKIKQIPIKQKIYYTPDVSAPDLKETKFKSFPIEGKVLDLYQTTENSELAHYGNFKEYEKILLTKDNLWTENYRIWLLDIETRMGMPEKADKEITSITFYDNYLKKYIFFSYRPNVETPFFAEIEPTKVIDENVQMYLFENETQMLLHFLEFTNKNNPDIISGWFSNSYDIPYIINRLNNLKLPVEMLSITNNPYDVYCRKNKRYSYSFNNNSNTSNEWFLKINGINLIDYKDMFDKVSYKTNVPNYQLDEVSKFLLGEEYGKYGGHFDKDAFDNDFKKFFRYALTDVYLLKKIEDKYKFFDYFRSLQKIVPLPPKDLFANSKIILFTTQKKVIDKYRVPTKFQYDKTSDDYNGFKGAYVLNPVAGFYKNVIVFDFQSLYPSTMITFNIAVDSFRKNKTGIRCSFDDKTYYFDDKNESEIVKFIREFYETRFKIKKELKTINKNDEKWNNLNQQQYALKILMNSIYGVMGFESFPLFHKSVAESITGMARNAIKFAKKYIEDNFNNVKIIAGDTDSLFIHFPNRLTKDDVMKDANSLIEKVNANMINFVIQYIDDEERIKNHKLKMSIDKVFSNLLMFDVKKRYVGVTFENELLITGFDIVKKNTPEFFKKELKNIMKELVVKKYIDDETIENIFEKMKSVPLKEIGAPVSFNKDINKGYNKTLPQHVRAARWSNEFLNQNIKTSDHPYLYYIKPEQLDKKFANNPTTVITILDFEKAKEKIQNIPIDWELTFYKHFLKKIENIGLYETDLIIKEWTEKYGIKKNQKTIKSINKNQNQKSLF